MAKKKAVKKKAKPKAAQWRMKFYNLKVNEEDINFLRFCVESERDMAKEWMDNPGKGVPEKVLEDWVIARDGYAQALKLLQLIDRVYKPQGVR